MYFLLSSCKHLLKLRVLDHSSKIQERHIRD